MRGTEMDIVQFWSFDSAPYTAVFRDARTVTANVYCLLHVSLSVWPQVSARFTLDESTSYLFEGLHENVLRKSKLIKMAQKGPLHKDQSVFHCIWQH